MKTIKRILFFVIAAVSTTTCLNAQQVGTWRTHFVYNAVTDVVQTPNKVFALSNGSIYSVDRRDKSVELYSKMSGLNDTDIATIAYNEQTKTLVVAYANSNIDLITDDGIFNISSLETQSMQGSKRINSIYMDGKFAYLACDFGILVLNLDKNKREVADTYIIGPGSTSIPVSSITMSNDSIYAASGTDIYRALKGDRNLSLSTRWEVMGTTGFPEAALSQKNKTIVYWYGRLYVLKEISATSGVVYSKTDGANWATTPIWASGVRSIRAQRDRLLMNNNNTIRSYNTSNVLISPNITTTATATNPMLAVEYLVREGEYWFAGNALGLINWTKNADYKPTGPASKDARDMYTFGDKIFVNTSAVWDIPTLMNDSPKVPAAIMMYSNGVWSNIVQADIPTGTTRTNFAFISSLAADPRNNNNFFASVRFYGLYEFRNGVFYKRHDSSNSPIRSPSGGTAERQLTFGLTYDNEGENLWFFNALQPSNSIKILKRDDTWAELNYSRLNNIEKADRIYIDTHNNKWVNILRGGLEAVFVFNENGTFDNSNDDRIIEFNSSNKFVDQDDNSFFAVPRYFVEDKTGKMWIGTDSGPIIIENPANIFTSNRCTRIKVPRNDGTNYADYLLDGIQVNAIAVDGANRKWIGTAGNGVFLVSENGTSIIRHFTTDNSPLLFDNVNSLTLSDLGELFLATDLGICSYQTDATEAGSGVNPFENVYAFPNPVTENYNGVISIVGLQTDSNVKITDIYGNIVYETTSKGGMATWDGRNKNGQKSSTGIYLVYCSNESASETVATKIMVVNR